MGTAKHSPFRVLVVDDDAEQRTLLTQLIAAHGFCAQSAADGAEALQIHQRTPADVIVTDLMMPTMDGFELLRHLEANGDRTPTIVLTGFGSIESDFHRPRLASILVSGKADSSPAFYARCWNAP